MDTEQAGGSQSPDRERKRVCVPRAQGLKQFMISQFDFLDHAMVDNERLVSTML